MRVALLRQLGKPSLHRPQPLTGSNNREKVLAQQSQWRWVSSSPSNGVPGIPRRVRFLPLSSNARIAELQQSFYTTATERKAPDEYFNCANSHFEAAERASMHGASCDKIIGELKAAILPLIKKLEDDISEQNTKIADLIKYNKNLEARQILREIDIALQQDFSSRFAVQ